MQRFAGDQKHVWCHPLRASISMAQDWISVDVSTIDGNRTLVTSVTSLSPSSSRTSRSPPPRYAWTRTVVPPGDGEQWAEYPLPSPYSSSREFAASIDTDLGGPWVTAGAGKPQPGSAEGERKGCTRGPKARMSVCRTHTSGISAVPLRPKISKCMRRNWVNHCNWLPGHGDDGHDVTDHLHKHGVSIARAASIQGSFKTAADSLGVTST